MKNFFIQPNFYPSYKKLRSEFTENFTDPKSTTRTTSKRFVWDYWYVENKYNLIRTPAFHYFNAKEYQQFHSYLVQWGRQNLGCHNISPPWLSYYVDGCFQNFHSDVPHGPWAFVYSLTPNRKQFRGGETLILKPETLNYWKKFSDQSDHEYESFLDVIPSKMNQLVVFDPRFPHGVSEVKGTRNPLDARLVIHGWFVNPRPYVVGGLSTSQVQKSLNSAFENLNLVLEQIDLLNGTVSLRLRVSKAGQVTHFGVLTNTLLSVQGNTQSEKYLLKELKNIFSYVQFPKTKLESQITIPLLFK